MLRVKAITVLRTQLPKFRPLSSGSAEAVLHGLHLTVWRSESTFRCDIASVKVRENDITVYSFSRRGRIKRLHRWRECEKGEVVVAPVTQVDSS